MIKPINIPIAALVVTLLTCSLDVVSGAAAQTQLQNLPSPAPSNSSLSRVVANESGEIYLSWVTQNAGQATLAYSRLSSEGWNTPKEISQGDNWFINWADFPALSVDSRGMVAHWLQISAQGTYDYDIRARFYSRDSQAWTTPKTVHTDGINAEHGFVSMLPLKDGTTLITWLDGRETKHGDPLGAMTLRAGIFDKYGSIVNEWELDHRVCDCCQTSSAMTEKGPIVAYRDRTAQEVRDIFITLLIDGVWTSPRPIHNDNWQIAGCPVNGPSVAAKNEKVAVAWFSAKDDTPKVQLVMSKDNGLSFSEPIVVESPNTNGRVGTAILDSGSIVVSWIDTTEAARIMLSRYDTNGEFLEYTEVARSSASRRSGFPIIEAVGNSVFITWTDISSVPQIKVARIDY
jgi:hypothetical protein|tara:strand:+ start:5940 stop:7145 length:1206 start_codon:yes stop_codon:yes gene_type:complete